MIYSIHVFDRAGRVLFSKGYNGARAGGDSEDDAEREKLVFGMVFSLKQICNELAPADAAGQQQQAPLECIKTGGRSLHCFETVSGIRFLMYTDTSISSMQAPLRQIFTLWVETVTRCPSFQSSQNVAETTFEAQLDAFLEKLPSFR